MTNIAIICETDKGESRCASNPETVKKFIQAGFEITVQQGAGVKASIPDGAFQKAGAKIAKSAELAVKNADIVLAVRNYEIVKYMKPSAALIALLNPYGNPKAVTTCMEAGVRAFALELIPRITRAQSMDVLSSQSNLAGYRAVLEAAYYYHAVFPMMMTAAGTLAPARMFIMGAGVAGLQAIATAKRLGAIVSATDVRPIAAEQVESLAAEFIMVKPDSDEEGGEGEGGYAKEMSKQYQKKQAELVASHIPKQDIIITTALIPGKKAPLLISQKMVETMKAGSIIIDMAVENGGNCALSKPESIVEHKGVKIIGLSQHNNSLALNATQLYARNLFHFVENALDENGNIKTPEQDEIIAQTMLCYKGKIIHPALK